MFSEASDDGPSFSNMGIFDGDSDRLNTGLQGGVVAGPAVQHELPGGHDWQGERTGREGEQLLSRMGLAPGKELTGQATGGGGK